jgi:hypothetical protein
MKRLKEKILSAADAFYLASLMILFAFWQINPEIMFLITCAYALCFLRFVLKFNIAKPLLIGLFIAASYLTFYRDFYHYQAFTFRILDYPLFPLAAWPLALTLLSYYIHILPTLLKQKKVWMKIATAYGVYVIMLIILEYTAYHYLNIRLTSNYASLPLIDCLHTPLSMKVVYFANGLAFFTMYFFLEDQPRTKNGLILIHR